MLSCCAEFLPVGILEQWWQWWPAILWAPAWFPEDCWFRKVVKYKCGVSHLYFCDQSYLDDDSKSFRWALLSSC